MKTIKRYGMGGAVQSFSSPMLAQGMQGGLSGFGTSGIPAFAKGGRVNIVERNEGNYYYRRIEGAIGSFQWKYDNRYPEGILFPLDDFDYTYTIDVKLKKGEALFRYETDIMMGRMRPLIKLNLDKSLIYFGIDTDDNEPKFESRGVKAEYIVLEEGYDKKYAKGGKMNEQKYSVQIFANGKAGESATFPNVEPKQFADINDAMKFAHSVIEENPSEIDKIKIFSSEGRLVQEYNNSDSDKNVKENYLYKQKIPNNYQGKTAEQIWNLLTPYQRSHYLDDHENGDYADLIHEDWDNLNDRVRIGFELHTKRGQYAKGGKTGFDALSKKVARRYKGKKVDKEYQDEYGKTYDAEEAKEVGDKVAGKVYRQQLAKKGMMAKGGEVEVRGDSLDEIKRQAKLISKNWKKNTYVLETTSRNFTTNNKTREYTWGDDEDVNHIKSITHDTRQNITILMRYNNGNLMSAEEEIIYESPYLKNFHESKYGQGGKAEVHIENKGVKFDKKRYKGILSDFDEDGLPNVDDPDPFGKQDKSSIEQVKFSNTFNKVLDTKKSLDLELKKFVTKLQNSTSGNEKIYARTKTPFSILNKLVDSRLLDEKRGLKDLVGTTITFKDLKTLEKYMRKVRRGDLGKVLDYDDYYTNPNDGYRAYHFIVEQDGIPIELQLKTDRMKEVNILSHDAYKNKTLNKDYMLYLTNLASEADKGNKISGEQFAELMADKAQVRKRLSTKN